MKESRYENKYLFVCGLTQERVMEDIRRTDTDQDFMDNVLGHWVDTNTPPIAHLDIKPSNTLVKNVCIIKYLFLASIKILILF